RNRIEPCSLIITPGCRESHPLDGCAAPGRSDTPFNRVTLVTHAAAGLTARLLQRRYPQSIAISETVMTSSKATEKYATEGQPWSTPPIVSPHEWQAARERLLVK